MRVREVGTEVSNNGWIVWHFIILVEHCKNVGFYSESSGELMQAF